MTTWQDVLRPGEASDFFSRVALPPFDASASTYVEGNALWLAELSRLVYRHDTEEGINPPRPTRSSYLARVAGWRQRRFFLCTDTDTQAMLLTCGQGPTPDFAVLVFRGTDSPRDRRTNTAIGLQFLARHQIGVHQGFQRALDSVWEDVEGELAQLCCPIFYTGHSLGGALATLAAARRAPHATYTFGSPRVGNRAFAQSLTHARIYRVVDAIDVVTMLPPGFVGFCHVGQKIHLKAPARRHSPLAWLSRWGQPPVLLADHAPVNYIDRMPTVRHAGE
jgi:pimeloyl-ACP methyl ester carboxylesterase